MSEDGKVKQKMCTLDENECVSLLDILNSFNIISEEQAWALCYQCAKCFKNEYTIDPTKCKIVRDLDKILLHKDGEVHRNTVLMNNNVSNLEQDNAGLPSPGHRTPAVSERELVDGIGCVVYRALDYGLGDNEERSLHPDLYTLFVYMDGRENEEERQGGTAEMDDEGIERDACEVDIYDGHSLSQHPKSLNTVLKICSSHIGAASFEQATSHYKAVCRALVVEVLDLSKFLNHVTSPSTNYCRGKTEVVPSHIDNLDSTDWTRLWIQVIRELRHGVQLKKVCYSRRPIEYELTPYEILMEDIRSRRYKLKEVMVDGNIPQRVKKDAHAIILEFIRSRPPLKKASERKLAPKICDQTTPRERLLESIKQRQVKLRPVSCTSGRDVSLKKKVITVPESCDTPFREGTRRLIKVDFSALETDEDDDEEAEVDNDKGTARFETPPKSSRRNFWHRTAYDLATQCPSRRASMRRHTIVSCEHTNTGSLSVPQSRPASRQTVSSDDSLGCTLPEMSWSRSSLQEDLFQSKQWQEDCLALTLEEIVHIRSVLTKAELDSLPVEGHVKEDAEKRKVCFLCMKTRFSIFGPWGQICKLCKRTVCVKCYSKMRIPTEHFAHVPVVALSPSMLSPEEDNAPKSLMSKLLTPTPANRGAIGSAPASPKLHHSTPHSLMSTSLISDHGGPMSLPPPSPAYTPTYIIRGKLNRSKTLGRPTGKAEKLKGLQMIVCHDCKTMVIQIIKSSRTTRNNAIRNLTLDLSPVY